MISRPWCLNSKEGSSTITLQVCDGNITWTLESKTVHMGMNRVVLALVRVVYRWMPTQDVHDVRPFQPKIIKALRGVGA